ncbi:MAG: SurA N-terminal domain-containing protein, partial [Rickettsiales bacterium]|nr:SurA N-terminal domain-containing protein [Rickettsiales bacterium]
MLDSMRKLSKGIISKLLMGLLIVSFAVWGIGDILTNTGPNYAAKVGGQTISLSEFQQQKSLVTRQLEALNIKELPQGQLELSVIRQLVQQRLTLQSMQDMGLTVNDALASKTIASIPDFKGLDGKFSATAFHATLAQQKLTEHAFVNQLRHDIAGRFLIESLSMKDANPPKSIIALEALASGETRDAVLLTVPATAAIDEKDETALKAFYDENKTALYLRPETRTLEYVVLSEADIQALVNTSITDASINDFMASRKDVSKEAARAQLQKEQRESVLHDVSNTVEDELAAGKTIGEAFAKAGISASPRTIENASADLAKTSGDDIIKTVAEQGFGLSEGEISRLIRTKQGVLLMVSAKKINAASPKAYDEVKADVRTRLGQQLARDAARTKAQSVKAALAK